MSALRSLGLALLLIAPAKASARDLAPRSLNPLSSLDVTSLKSFVEKPLFEASRHPPVPPAPVAVNVPPPPPPPAPAFEPPPPFRLLGVVEGAHSLAAIVRRADTGKTETLRPGDRVGGWTVQILPSSLRVQNGDRSFDYAMFNSLQNGPQPVDQSRADGPSPALAAARNLLTGGAR